MSARFLTSRRVIAALAVLATATACAHESRLQLTRPVVPPTVPPASRVLIMPAFVVGTARPGNAGRDFPAIQAELTATLLSAVRSRFPDSALARIDLPIAFPVAAYRSVMPAGWFNPDELHAVSDAYQQRAAFLLVPAITEWTEMRTDDPIGTFIPPHSSVTIDLRLMRLQPPALAAETSFHHRARLTLNRKAMHLVDDRFRQTVLRLFGA